MAGDLGPVDELGRPLRRARFRGFVFAHKRDPNMPGLIRLPNLKGLEKVARALFEAKRARVEGMPALVRLVKEEEQLFEKETSSDSTISSSEEKEKSEKKEEKEQVEEKEEKENNETKPGPVSDESTESQSDIVWDSESEDKTEEKKEDGSSEIMDLVKTSSSDESTQTEDSIINVISD